MCTVLPLLATNVRRIHTRISTYAQTPRRPAVRIVFLASSPPPASKRIIQPTVDVCWRDLPKKKNHHALSYGIPTLGGDARGVTVCRRTGRVENDLIFSPFTTVYSKRSRPVDEIVRRGGKVGVMSRSSLKTNGEPPNALRVRVHASVPCSDRSMVCHVRRVSRTL